MAKDGKFIQKATEKMKKKGTIGSFGKATEKKIAKAKRQGGTMEKKAVFAENMKKIAKKHKGVMKMVKGEQSSHKAIGAQEGKHH